MNELTNERMKEWKSEGMKEWRNERFKELENMEVKLKPEYRMIHELHGRVGNWIYRTRKYANGETKIFANYSPKKNGDPDPKWGKLFE